MKYNTYTLDNGLRIIHLPSDSKVVYCGYQINAGTRNEEPGEEGLAHFCEHVTFKGTERRKAWHILNCLESVGGDLNAYTNKEGTVYYSAILKEHIARAVDLLTDIVFHSVYPQAEIDKEVEVICDEIESYNDSPAELIYDEFENIIFKGSPLGHNILGTAEQVRSFKTEDALRFTRKLYRPDNAIFFAYGDIDFKKLVKLIQKALGECPKGRELACSADCKSAETPTEERIAEETPTEERIAEETPTGETPTEEMEAGDANHKVQSSLFKVQSKEVQSNELPAFLANGDRAKVMKVSRRIDLYGFHFATLLLKFPDYDNYELETTVLLDTLTSEAPALPHEQQEQLFRQIEEDYQDIPLKADRMKAIRQDPYFNALQVKFAYAVTCHKAQGGQWSHVYVDQGYMTDDMLTPDYIHWLYTAFTRATEMLYLVNWPNTQIEG